MPKVIEIELMLAGWSETHNGGAKVTFWLPSSEELEHFRSLTVAKGGTAGQRFMAALALLEDEPAADAKDRRREPMGARCRLAVQWCRDPQFQQWVLEELGDIADVDSKPIEERAKLAILRACGVGSRRDLDTIEVAGRLFDSLIRRPYAKHCGA